MYWLIVFFSVLCNLLCGRICFLTTISTIDGDVYRKTLHDVASVQTAQTQQNTASVLVAKNKNKAKCITATKIYFKGGIQRKCAAKTRKMKLKF